MTKEEMLDLVRFDAWATDRTLESVSALTREQYEKDLGSSHGGVRGTLVHTFSADTIWFARWQGEAPTKAISAEEVPTLDALKSRWKEYQQRLEAYVRGLDDRSLHAPFGYKDFKGNPYTVPLQNQIQHKVNHSSYHRGQVVTMLRQLGAKPQSTDLIQYFRLPLNRG